MVSLGDACLVVAPDGATLRVVLRLVEDMEPSAIPRAVWTSHATRTLGPAVLYFADSVADSADTAVREIQRDDPRLLDLGTRVPVGDAVEAGMTELSSSVFVTFDGPRVAAACGYRVWPGGIAHMAVLVDVDVRRRGLGRQVALAAARDAIASGLLIQWRARPPASQALAHSLGLGDLGAQMSVQLKRHPNDDE